MLAGLGLAGALTVGATPTVGLADAGIVAGSSVTGGLIGTSAGMIADCDADDRRAEAELEASRDASSAPASASTSPSIEPVPPPPRSRGLAFSLPDVR